MLGLYRLATVKRYDGDDLRVNWAEYNEHNFVNIRGWTPGDDGAWFPCEGKGPDGAPARSKGGAGPGLRSRQQPRLRPLRCILPATGHRHVELMVIRCGDR